MRLVLLCSLLACAHARPAPLHLPPPWPQQLALREGWLAQRHAALLPLMRRHGVAMWIVVNEEFHDDPLTQFVAPPRPLAGNRDLFVFVDAGEAGLKRYALTGYAEEAVLRFFESPEDFRKIKEGLQQVAARHEPRTIALSIEPAAAAPPAPGAVLPASRGVTRSLTLASYRFLVDALGPEREKRFVPAAPLIEEYLDTRLPEERAAYAELVQITEELARRALSDEVIRPGHTRVGELRNWLYERLGERGLPTWFQPDLRVQRRGLGKQTSRGFLAVASEDVVIERGDLLHLDFGLTALGLNTDWQKMAYVLKDGETDAPLGLRAALQNTNALQDALVHAARPGRAAAEVYDEVMAAMQAQSAAAVAAGKPAFTAEVYSHPLGAQGHGLGASIDFRSAQRREPGHTLRAGSYLAVELNTQTPAAEWDGQVIYAMEEDPAELTADGYRFFVPRQTAFYLVR